MPGWVSDQVTQVITRRALIKAPPLPTLLSGNVRITLCLSFQAQTTIPLGLQAGIQ